MGMIEKQNFNMRYQLGFNKISRNYMRQYIVTRMQPLEEILDVHTNARTKTKRMDRI